MFSVQALFIRHLSALFLDRRKYKVISEPLNILIYFFRSLRRKGRKKIVLLKFCWKDFFSLSKFGCSRHRLKIAKNLFILFQPGNENQLLSKKVSCKVKKLLIPRKFKKTKPDLVRFFTKRTQIWFPDEVVMKTQWSLKTSLSYKTHYNSNSGVWRLQYKLKRAH